MAKAKWNLDFFQRADRKSGEISRWIGETRGPKIASSNMLLLWERRGGAFSGVWINASGKSDRPTVYRGVGRDGLLSSQVNWRAGQPEFGRHPHQVGKGVGFHFLHDLPAVCLYRDFADTEFAAHLFIQQSGGD